MISFPKSSLSENGFPIKTKVEFSRWYFNQTVTFAVFGTSYFAAVTKCDFARQIGRSFRRYFWADLDKIFHNTLSNF